MGEENEYTAITVRLSPSEIKVLERLKNERHSSNTSQIVREALYALEDFLFNQNRTYKCEMEPAGGNNE